MKLINRFVQQWKIFARKLKYGLKKSAVMCNLQNGAQRSPVSRQFWELEAAGSNPAVPTNKLKVYKVHKV